MNLVDKKCEPCECGVEPIRNRKDYFLDSRDRRLERKRFYCGC